MRSALSLGLALTLLGCTKNTTENQSAPSAEAAGSGQSSKAQATPGTKDDQPKSIGGAFGQALGQLTQAAKAMQQVGEAAGQGATMGPAVNWRKLSPFLGDQLGDFKAAGVVDGSTQAFGAMQASQVRRRYTAGDRTLRLSVADTSLVPMLRAVFSMAGLAAEDSTQRIQKGITVEGQQGIAEWQRASKRAKVSVLVAGRFVVTASLRPTENFDEAVALLKKLDLKAIAALK
jgi:hypothetical protein